MLGFTDISLLDQCVDAIAARDGAACFEVVQRVVSSGHDPRRFVEDLLQRLRDLLILAVAGDQAQAALGSLPVDQLERMQVQARAWVLDSCLAVRICVLLLGHHGGGY